MKTCKTCKYKTLDKDRGDRILCSKLEHGYKEDVGVLSEYADDAYFVTTDDFGCVLHEEKK